MSFMFGQTEAAMVLPCVRPVSGLRQRRGLNLMCKSLALVGLICCGFLFMSYQSANNDQEAFGHRELRANICEVKTTTQRNDACPEAPPAYMIVPYFIGSMYIFWAIAIVCDDFFVPALEVIGERLNIGDDIAGATLMAAGGSAPELATSVIGTFTGSDVGFGTIVGSAVFNVLFVIACCVAFTPDKYAPLLLTWWPLARDCSCYIVCLVTLAIFFGVITPNEIELWEALILFGLYIAYCTIMYFNEELQARFMGVKVTPDDENSKVHSVPSAESDVRKEGSVSDNGSPRASASGASGTSEAYPFVRRSSLYKASKFRSGFFSSVTNNNLSVFDNAGIGVVYKLKGTVKDMFNKLDVDKSGSLERCEVETLLKLLFEGTNQAISDREVDEIMNELDLDKNGVISLDEFSQWYIKSGAFSYSCMRVCVFDCLNVYIFPSINREKVTV